MLEALKPVMARTAGLRRFGAATLDFAYVAAGRYDAFWEYGLAPWDSAAGIVLVREAGGFVSEIDGGADPLYGASILAANDARKTRSSGIGVRKGGSADRPAQKDLWHVRRPSELVENAVIDDDARRRSVADVALAQH